MLVQNFWCRYLCPYGALLGLVSLLSPVEIRRDAEACIDCAKCARACPAALPVDRLVQIRSAECTRLHGLRRGLPRPECAAVLPAAAPGRVARARWFRRALGPLAVACILAYIFFGVILYAHATSHWQTHLSRAVYSDLVPGPTHSPIPACSCRATCLAICMREALWKKQFGSLEYGRNRKD